MVTLKQLKVARAMARQYGHLWGATCPDCVLERAVDEGDIGALNYVDRVTKMTVTDVGVFNDPQDMEWNIQQASITIEFKSDDAMGVNNGKNSDN